ncbi:pyruvate kinase [Vigna unguiculata]|uniref:Pyruvate kinase n=1 Tax=Vigna unguiculata TaxID=3917 RepID=A0A4D6M6L1_VIGUN|nr:pyruvate kinase [Vigna unguiculata]
MLLEGFYLGPPPKDKLPKNSLQGSVLVGSISYGKLSFAGLQDGKRPEKHLVSHRVSYIIPPNKDWEDIKFGVDNQVDFYAVSFVKDARVVHELKEYLRSHNVDIHVIIKIESADSIPNLHSILSALDRVYLIADNRILVIKYGRIVAFEPEAEVFFGPRPGEPVEAEIIGLSVSTSGSTVYINVKKRGLFAYHSHGY